MLFKPASVLTFAIGALAQTQNLGATLAGNSDLSSLLGLLNSTGLASAIGNAQNVTVLAPSNDAISALLNSTAGASLSSNPGLVTAVLQYHILQGVIPASAISNTSAFVPTMLTNTTYANVTGGQVVQAVLAGGNATFFSGLTQNSSVVQADLNFTGGVIHVIDTVLTLPANISTSLVAANLTSLYGALNATSLLGPVDGMQDITVFAPNNAAFRSIGSALANLTTEEITGILGYHVVNGTVGYSSGLTNGTTLTSSTGETLTVRFGENGAIFVNNARVITPDVLVANGVCHVIDAVLNPAATTASPSASATAGAPGFTGASSATEDPYTSGVATPTSSIASGGATAAASASSTAAAAPMQTGAVGAAALFGAGALMWNY